MSDINYKEKYLKYKQKYLELKQLKQDGGGVKYFAGYMYIEDSDVVNVITKIKEMKPNKHTVEGLFSLLNMGEKYKLIDFTPDFELLSSKNKTLSLHPIDGRCTIELKTTKIREALENIADPRGKYDVLYDHYKQLKLVPISMNQSNPTGIFVVFVVQSSYVVYPTKDINESTNIIASSYIVFLGKTMDEYSSETNK